MQIKAKKIENQLSPLNDLLGTILSLIGFFLFIFLYSRNHYYLNDLILNIKIGNVEKIFNSLYSIFNTYFNDLSSFVLQSSNYIIMKGYSFEVAIKIYKEFAINFSNIFAISIMYFGLYLRTTGSTSRRILKITSNSILIVSTAFVLSLAN